MRLHMLLLALVLSFCDSQTGTTSEPFVPTIDGSIGEEETTAEETMPQIKIACFP